MTATSELSATPREQADELGSRLIDLGFDVHISRSNGAHQNQPYLRIISAESTEFVFVATDPQTQDGVRRFWWASLAPIGPADDIDSAVTAIVAEMGPPLHIFGALTP